MLERISTQRFTAKASSEAKRLRTRALLMDAAVTVFARRGVDSASISEVTAEAGVANGTFYYHFRDKSELIDIVGHEIAAQLVAEVDAAMHALGDGTERVAFGTQCFVRFAAEDHEWGRLVVNALTDMRDFRDRISAGVRKDVAIGVRQKGFASPTNELLFASILAVVAMGLRSVLDGGKARAVEIQTAEMVLQLFGMSRQAARELVRSVGPALSKMEKRSTTLAMANSAKD